LAVHKDSHSNKYRATADYGGRDIVWRMELNAGKYVPFAACSAWAQADFIILFARGVTHRSSRALALSTALPITAIAR